MKNITTVCLMALLFCSCNKKTANNNYVNNDQMAAYSVIGLKQVVINTDLNAIYLPLTIAYNDYGQPRVQLSVTGLPPGITINSDFATSGYPTFSTTLVFYDTGFLSPANIGDYTAVLNVQNDSGETRAFPFDITVNRPDTCAGRYAGAYPASMDATASIHYADSIFMDTSVTNRIWFTNFAGTGKAVMGMITNCKVSIPSQTVGGMLFSGGGKLSAVAGYRIELNVKAGSNFYVLYMN